MISDDLTNSSGDKLWVFSEAFAVSSGRFMPLHLYAVDLLILIVVFTFCCITAMFQNVSAVSQPVLTVDP